MIWPGLKYWYSFSKGSLTLMTISVSHASSAEPIFAPAAMYSSSGKPEPTPAPFSTITEWPA